MHICLFALLSVVCVEAQLEVGGWPSLGGGFTLAGRISATGNTSLPLLQVWSTRLYPMYSIPVVGASGTVFAGSESAFVYAFNGSTGALRWSYGTGGAVQSTAALGADGSLYVGSFDKKVYALNASTGALRWSFTTGDAVRTSPAIGPSGTIFVSSDDRKLYAFSPAGGAPLWTFTSGASAGARALNSPSLSPDGATVFVGTCDPDYKLVALNAATGAVRWSYTSLGYPTPAAVAPSGVVYFGTGINYSGFCPCVYLLVALSAATGALQWQRTLATQPQHAPSLTAAGTILIIDNSGVLLAVSPSNALLWSRSFGGNGPAASVVIGGDGTLYLSTVSDHSLYALDATTGATKWSFVADADAGGVAIGPDGTIFATQANGFLAALRHTQYPCPAGQGASVLPGQTTFFTSNACAFCPSGSYSDPAKGPTLRCTLCSPGSFATATGLSACQPCSPGSYGPSAGAGGCVPCDAGTYLPDPGATSRGSCRPCPDGTYNAAQGQLACVACQAGTYNNNTGNTTADACTRCPLGTFSAVAGRSAVASCRACPLGSYADSTGSTECTPCAEGTYIDTATALPVSASFCKACPEGQYGVAAGASSCLSCPAGTYQPTRRATSAQACLPCARGTFGALTGGASVDVCTGCSPGSYSDATGSASCKLCRSGTYSLSVGATDASTCTLCPPNSFNPASGASSCILCPAGTQNFNSGSSSLGDCAPCATGSFNPLAGGTCAVCPRGSYTSASPDGRLYACTACPAGSVLTTTGTSSADCAPCPPGFFVGSLGSTSCLPCASGAFSPGGLSACEPCAFDTYQPAGASARCSLCPRGLRTSSTGSTAASQCLALAFTACAAGTQPKGLAPPQGPDDCTALLCPAPLRAANDSSGCVGCAPGFAADPVSSACLACSVDSFCPGSSISFSGAALLSLSSSSGDASNASAAVQGGGATAVQAAGGAAPAPATPSDTLSACANFMPPSAPPAASAISLADSLVIAVGAGVILLATISACVIGCEDTGGAALTTTTSAAAATASHDPDGAPQFCVAKAKGRLRALFLSIDMQAIRKPDSPSERQLSFRPTPLGGLCTFAGIVVIACLALILIIRRQRDNVSTAQSLAVLDPSVLAADLLAPQKSFSSSPSDGGVASPSSSSWTGVRVRIFSPAGSGCEQLAAVPGSFAPSGLAAGSWGQPTPVADCGDGRSAIVLACPSCVFSATSSLSLALPYQCQALQLDAAAVDASGDLSIASFPLTTASSDGRFLKNVSWTLAPVLSVISDATNGGSLVRGLRLLALSKVSLYAPSAATAGGGQATAAPFLPLSASVFVTIDLPLQSYYALAVLTEKTSSLQLFSSIVGLAGILGAFRILFSLVHGTGSAPVARRLSKTALKNVSFAYASRIKGGRRKSLVTGAAAQAPSTTSTTATSPAALSAMATRASLNPIHGTSAWDAASPPASPDPLPTPDERAEGGAFSSSQRGGGGIQAAASQRKDVVAMLRLPPLPITN